MKDKEHMFDASRPTEDQQAAEALRRSEEKYRSLFENSLDGILLVKRDNSIVDANRQGCRILGYTHEELTAMTIADLHPEAEHPRALQLKEQSIQTGSFRDVEELHYRHKDGHLIPVSITATIIKSISDPLAMVYFRDITERKQAERALRDSEERFRSLVANIPGTVYRCEISHPWRVEHISDAVVDITGYEASDFLESNKLNFGELILPEDVERVDSAIQDGITRHEPFGVEYRIHHADGAVRWVHEKGVAVYDSDGKAVWLDGVIMDITERKHAELEREHLLGRLATKNEELQSIVYVASHDLKTPLVNIQGFSGELSKTCEKLKAIFQGDDIPEDLKERIAPLLHEDVPEALHFISAGSAKMQSLLNGLLAVARVGSATFEIEDLNMNELITGVIASMQFQISDSGAEITVGELPSCRGDADHISQVFSNLLTNAVKYLHPSRSGHISVSGHTTDSQAVYCVSDNGLGIAPEHQEKVFEIFHRLENEKNVKGEGLGLTIAQRILDRHHGAVRLESEEEKGSRFFVYLPAVKS